nr:hypothetical protein [Tanacetum cinerariifolium]
LGDSEDALMEVPAVLAHSDRILVLFFMGGDSMAEAAENAVVVEADAFKETDANVDEINEMFLAASFIWDVCIPKNPDSGEDALMKVLAVLAHRDRILVLFFMGGGMGDSMAEAAENAVVVEADAFKETDEKVENEDEFKVKKPYKIEMRNLVCDPYLAVTRGIRYAGKRPQKVGVVEADAFKEIDGITK